MITANDLPKGQGKVVFDIEDGMMLTLERRSDDLFYGQTESFDIEENGTMMVAKLNRWGATVVGWE